VESLKLKIEGSWGIIETVSEKEKAFGYRFYPDKVKGEGFFIAAFKKGSPGEEANDEVIPHKAGQKAKPKKIKDVLSAKEMEVLGTWLDNVTKHFFIKQNEELIALPVHLEHELSIIQSSLYIKKAGVKLGTMIRNELIPAHDLAVSKITSNNIPRINVDIETALQYLRKEEFTVEPGMKGWVLLTYEQLPLGWIKIIGNRINNYYPKEWRILNK
jgi:NOL1/NOP2/fmu family ribosome biogenesis protein